jgi:hypothetical protein
VKSFVWIGLAASLLMPAGRLEAQGGQDHPTTPDEKGHILKMTREMIKLGTTRDQGSRMELFLKVAHERARELRTLQSRGKSSHQAELGRSYEILMTKGAPGTIEQGAAKGRDMKPAMARYAEMTRRHREEWKEFLSQLPPGERAAFLRAAEAAERAHEHGQEAEERGLRVNLERRRLSEERPKAPGGKPNPETPKPGDADEARREQERREAERRREMEERERARIEELRHEYEERLRMRHHRH